MSIDQRSDASRQFWDEVAGAPERGHLPGLLESNSLLAAYRDRTEKLVLVDRAGDRLTGARVLEVGCGGGRWTTWLAERVASVHATDIAANMIDHARKRASAARVGNATFEVAAGRDVAAAGPFDVIYLGSCLHYMSDDSARATLERVTAVAAPGAALLSRDTVSLIGRAFERSERYGGGDPGTYRLADWYVEAARECGWRLVDDWPTFVPPRARRVRKLVPVRALRAALDWELCRAVERVRSVGGGRHRGDKQHRFFMYERGD